MNAHGFARVGAAATAVLAVVAMSACGSSSSGGDSKVKIGETAVSGKFTTSCTKIGGNTDLAIVDANNDKYGNFSAGAVVDGTTVKSVGIAGTKGGKMGIYGLGFGKGMSGGNASVKVDGKTYTVTGEGVSADMDVSNMDLTKAGQTKTEKFEVVFACADIKG